jgi:hypothetical protein
MGNKLDKQYTDLLKSILDYQIEKIIREGTTYEFEIIDSPSVSVDGEHVLAYTHTISRIKEHQLTSKFNSIREEFASRDECESVDFILTSMEYILTFLEEHVGRRLFIMSDSFNSGPDVLVGTFMGRKTIRTIII